MAGQRSEFVAFYAPLGLWTSVRVFPTPEGIVIFFQDITQQRRAEQALDDPPAVSARPSTPAPSAPGAGTWPPTASTSTSAPPSSSSPSRTPPSAAPSSAAASSTPTTSPTRPPISARPSLNGGTYSAEYRAEGPDKTQRWIAARGLATFDDAHEFTGMIGTVQDITDRKTQEATLRQSEKLAATGRLAATIAHEINNPLEAVTNLIYICKTDPTVPPAIQRLLDTADDELARVAQIAQQTLGFYRDTTRPGRDRPQRHAARHRRALLPQAHVQTPRLPHAHPARPAPLRPSG